MCNINEIIHWDNMLIKGKPLFLCIHMLFHVIVIMQICHITESIQYHIFVLEAQLFFDGMSNMILLY